MEVAITKENAKVCAVITGRLDTVTSEELKAKLEEADITGCDVELDFTNVEYISSAGLRLLVATQKKAAATSHTMVVKNINRVVKEVFRVAGFDKAIKVV